MSKGRIIILSHTSQIKGGAEKSLLEIIKDLRSQDFDCYVITPPGGDIGEELKKLGSKHVPLVFDWWAKRKTGVPFGPLSLHDGQSLVKVLELIETVKPDVCMTNTMVCPWLAYAAAITESRHVWMLREHGDDLDFRVPVEAIYQAIGRLSDKVFCNSTATKKFFEEKIQSDNKVGVVYPVVEPVKAGRSVSPFSSRAGLRLALVGQIKPAKRQLDAVEALMICREQGVDVELCLIGEAEDKQYAARIDDFINANKLKGKVKLLGYQKNPLDTLQYADFALGTSKQESFGRTVIEAMLADKPVIAANNDGFSEIIDDGVTGLLYKAGDVKELAEKILFLHKKPELKLSIAEAAKKEASSKYSRQKAHRELINYVKEAGGHQNNKTRDIELFLKVLTPLAEYPQLIETLGATKASLRTTQEKLEHKSKELDSIYDSKAWRLIERYRKYRRLIS